VANCPSCGAELEPGGRFCGSCGAASPPQPAFCWSCGGRLEDDAAFCGRCGAATEEPAATTAPGTPADAAVTTVLAGAATEGMTAIMPAARPASAPPVIAPPPFEPAASTYAPAAPPRRWAGILIAVLVIVIAIAAGVTVFALTRDDGSTPPPTSSSTEQTGDGAVAADGTASVESSTTEQPTPESTPTVAPTTLAAEDGQAIQDTLYAYFDGINARDYRAAWLQLAPSLRKTVRLARFAKGDSTSQDSDMVIHWMKKQTSSSVIAYVTFTSTQESEYGPNGDTLDYWTLEYHMKRIGGRWYINGTSGHNGHKYTPG
jgi:hypothetical protein